MATNSIKDWDQAMEKIIEVVRGFITEIPGLLIDIKRESEHIRKCIENIETKVVQKHITKEEGAVHLRIQKNAFETVLSAYKGIALIDAEKAVNAALQAIKDFVNHKLGFDLIT